MRRFFLPVPFFAFGIFVLVFTSCFARIAGPLKENGSVDLRISAALEPRMAALIRALAAVSGSSPAENSPLLNGPMIAQSMSTAPGIDSISLKNIAPAAIEGLIKISQIDEFLAPGGKEGVARLERGRSDGAGSRCLISLSRETGPEALSLLSPEISGYLNALMAPLATGEVLSKDEYLALVATVYGKTLADEIAGSRIRASIDFPGPVQSVKGGSFSGSRAEFDILLADLLVLETPLSYEVVWKRAGP